MLTQKLFGCNVFNVQYQYAISKEREMPYMPQQNHNTAFENGHDSIRVHNENQHGFPVPFGRFLICLFSVNLFLRLNMYLG